MALVCRVEEYSEGSLFASEEPVREESVADMPLTYAAMTSIAEDIKSTFSAAITDLKANRDKN